MGVLVWVVLGCFWVVLGKRSEVVLSVFGGVVMFFMWILNAAQAEEVIRFI